MALRKIAYKEFGFYQPKVRQTVYKLRVFQDHFYPPHELLTKITPRTRFVIVSNPKGTKDLAHIG